MGLLLHCPLLLLRVKQEQLEAGLQLLEVLLLLLLLQWRVVTAVAVQVPVCPLTHTCGIVRLCFCLTASMRPVRSCSA